MLTFRPYNVLITHTFTFFFVVSTPYIVNRYFDNYISCFIMWYFLHHEFSLYKPEALSLVLDDFRFSIFCTSVCSGMDAALSDTR